MYNNPWTSSANRVLKWNFFSFSPATCDKHRCLQWRGGFESKFWIQTAPIYRIFLKHDHNFAMAHITQEFWSKEDVDGNSLFFSPPSKPHKAKFQQTHCNFTLLFHSNEILVFYLKILLSNINKLDTVKLLIVHKSVWSCITGRHATNSFWWEILWE